MEAFLTDLKTNFPFLSGGIVFVLGAIFGSFANVCIYRIPNEESVVKPRSRCQSCKKIIPPYHNIPIVSWFILRGKCASCGCKFSIRYPFIEFLTAALFLQSWLHYSSPTAIIAMIFVFILLCSTWIDLDHMILPDRFTIGGMVIGVFCSFIYPELHHVVGDSMLLSGMKSALISIMGGLIGSAVLMWIAIFAEAVLQKEAMGFGDVKFMGCIGAFCGWKGALFAIFGGATIGSLILIPVMLFQKITRKPEDENEGLGMGIPIPFGPILALGAVIYFLFLNVSVDTYLESVFSFFQKYPEF